MASGTATERAVGRARRVVRRATEKYMMNKKLLSKLNITKEWTPGLDASKRK